MRGSWLLLYGFHWMMPNERFECCKGVKLQSLTWLHAMKHSSGVVLKNPLTAHSPMHPYRSSGLLMVHATCVATHSEPRWEIALNAERWFWLAQRDYMRLALWCFGTSIRATTGKVSPIRDSNESRDLCFESRESDFPGINIPIYRMELALKGWVDPSLLGMSAPAEQGGVTSKPVCWNIGVDTVNCACVCGRPAGLRPCRGNTLGSTPDADGGLHCTGRGEAPVY